jgi:hypothetical protein
MNKLIEYSIYKENAALRETRDATIEFLDKLYKENLPDDVKKSVARFCSSVRKKKGDLASF